TEPPPKRREGDLLRMARRFSPTIPRRARAKPAQRGRRYGAKRRAIRSRSPSLLFGGGSVATEPSLPFRILKPLIGSVTPPFYPGNPVHPVNAEAGSERLNA